MQHDDHFLIMLNVAMCTMHLIMISLSLIKNNKCLMFYNIWIYHDVKKGVSQKLFMMHLPFPFPSAIVRALCKWQHIVK